MMWAFIQSDNCQCNTRHSENDIPVWRTLISAEVLMDDCVPLGVSARLFPGPKTLSIMPTFQCSAQCADCGTFSSPYDKTTLNLETILSSIDQAKELGFANVVFTGGEASIRCEM